MEASDMKKELNKTHLDSLKPRTGENGANTIIKEKKKKIYIYKFDDLELSILDELEQNFMYKFHYDRKKVWEEIKKSAGSLRGKDYGLYVKAAFNYFCERHNPLHIDDELRKEVENHLQRFGISLEHDLPVKPMEYPLNVKPPEYERVKNRIENLRKQKEYKNKPDAYLIKILAENEGKDISTISSAFYYKPKYSK